MSDAELDALLAGVDGRWPLILLPVRLETRYAGTQLLVRVYPDPHVDTFEPALTADELEWGRQFRAGPRDRAEWAALADRYGPRRAAWIARRTAPGAAAPESRAGPWTRAARAAALPDCWIALGWRGGQRVVAEHGRPIAASTVALGPDPGAPAPAPPPPGVPIEERAAHLVDPGLRWMVDFRAAEEAGMGLRLDLGADVSAGLDRLVVLGVRTTSPTEGAAALTGLLDAHHYTDGLGLVPPGTPTNNLSTVERSGWSAAPDPTHADSFAVERGAPLCAAGDGGDGAALAAALGLDPAVFAHVEHADGATEADAVAMNTLLWSVTWGHLLDELVAAAPQPDLRIWARRFFVDRVRAPGPVRALRLGNQVCAVLPVLAPRHWLPGPAATLGHEHLFNALAALRPMFEAAANAVDPDQLTVDRLLAQTPVSARIEARAVFGGTVWPDTALWFMGVFRQQLFLELNRQRDRAAALAAALVNVAAGHEFPGTLQLTTRLPLTVPTVQADLRGHRLEPDYLTELAAVPDNPPPAAPTLLGRLARHALARAALPGTPQAPDELVPSLQHLAGRPPAVLDRLLRETLDLAGHRLDAWATALATDRLAEVRDAAGRARGVLLGGWGYLEDVRPRDTPASEGWLQAPSIGQAAAAAVLRSGYLSHGGSPAVAVDLGSDRVRLAGYLLEGVRRGQPLSALLGYRVERALHETAVDTPNGPFSLDACIGPLREVTPTEGRAVVDGLALARTPTDQLPFDAILRHLPVDPGLRAQARERVERVVADAAAALDAVDDAVLAESVYQLVQGNVARAGATLDGIVGGADLPPELEFTRTPRTGVGATQRVVLVPDPAAAAQPGWPVTPRGRAEPTLARWVGRLLGDPGALVLTVVARTADGAAVPGPGGAPEHRVTVAALGLGPLDLAHLATRIPELEARCAAHLQASLDAVRTTTLLPDATTMPAALPPVVFLELARAVGELAARGRALDARDLALPGAGDGRVDHTELTVRAAAAVTGLTAVGDAIDACLPAELVPARVPALRDALRGAADHGVPDAVPPPGPVTPETLRALAERGGAVRAEITARLAAAERESAPAAPATPAEVDAVVRAATARLRAVFGGPVPVLPLFVPDHDTVAAAFAGTAVVDDDPGNEPAAWLARLARVRPALGALETLALYAQTLAPATPLGLEVGQLPLVPGGQRWIGLRTPPSGPPGGRLALLAAGGWPGGNGALAGLLVDEIVEVVPNARVTTAVTFHHDAPDAVAPRVALLAVPPDVDQPAWTVGVLADTVLDTMALARCRGVDPTLTAGPGPDGVRPSVLDRLAQHLPAAFVAYDIPGEPGVPPGELVVPPPDLGRITTAPRPQLTGVSFDPAPFRGRTITVFLRGSGFFPQPLPPGDEWVTNFSAEGPGTFREGPPRVTDIEVSGRVRIAPDASLDPQTFALRTAMGTVRIGWNVMASRVDALVPAEIRRDLETDTTVQAVVRGAGLLGADVWIHRPNGPPTPWLAVVVETQAEHELGVRIAVRGIGPPPNRNALVQNFEEDARVSVRTPGGTVITGPPVVLRGIRWV